MTTPASTSTTPEPLPGDRVEIRVSLRLVSDTQTPEQMTAALGIQPDRSWRRGEAMRRARAASADAQDASADGGDAAAGTATPGRVGARFPQHGWLLRSALPPEAGLEQHVADLLGRLAGKESAVRAIAEHGSALISAAVYIYGTQAPPLSLAPTIVERMAQLSAALDIDLYLLAQD